jgi:hypothetical protein
LYRYHFEAFSRRPLLFDTFMRATMAPTPEPIDWGRDAGEAALVTELAGSEPGFAEDFILIVRSVFYAGMSFCARGILSFDDAWSMVERTVRRLVTEAPGP